MTKSVNERSDDSDELPHNSQYDGQGVNSPAATWMILIGLVVVSIVLGLIFH